MGRVATGGPVGGRSLQLPSRHVQLQQVAQATLTLFVDEIFAVGEVAATVLGLVLGSALRNGHLLTVQGDEHVLGGIWKPKRWRNASERCLEGEEGGAKSTRQLIHRVEVIVKVGS